MLTKELISFLKKFDTPTISNALDIIEVQDQPMGIQNTHLFQLIQSSSQ